MKLISAFLLVILYSFPIAAQKKYQRPAIKTPDTFRGSASATDTTSIGDLEWFEVFKDPDLQTLVKTALQQNYDLRNAIARIDVERANLGLTRSNQFPQFGAAAAIDTGRSPSPW